MNLRRRPVSAMVLPALALDLEHTLRRTLEVIPGLLTWGTLIGLIILAVRAPLATAMFLVLYDLYWLIRSFYIGSHLVSSYRLLRRMRGIDWLARLQLLDDPASALPLAEARVRDSERLLARAPGWRTRKPLSLRLWQEQKFLENLKAVIGQGSAPLHWRDLLHVVILPSFQEPLEVLEQSLDGIAASEYPKDRLWVVVALEERAGGHTRAVRQALEQRYANTFGRFFTTIHPDGIPGERQVKSANATYAARIVQSALDAEGIPYERVIVSNFDADTVVSKAYFGSLSLAYLVTPDRLRCSYQPLPLYHNNIWQAPAFTRVIATNSTFWLLIECMRPERLVTYSSHAMPFLALVDAGFWDPTAVSEDSRIFWQCYLRYDGDYRVVPLYTTISMDATRAPTMLRTLINQYKQKRRWAWGIENFPYIAREFLRTPRIPRRKKLRHCFVMLEAWHSWATASLILAGLGWIIVLFGHTEFQQTILAFNLPRVTRTLLTAGMFGLILNMTLSLILLPPPPPGTPKRKYLWMALQWVLVPFITWFLGSMPAIDAMTRLMFGRYLGFWVTPKVRETPASVEARPVALAHARGQ